jgi:hypothetical protein
VKGTGPLDRGYGGLTANQRVRLAIAALARDDDRERAFLWESAPKQQYLGHEVAYVDVMDLASEFATAFTAAELGPRYAKLELLELLQALIKEFLVPEPTDEDAEGTEPHVEGDASYDTPIEVLHAVLEKMRESLLAESAGIVHGFSSFCEQELRVHGNDVISAFARQCVPWYERFAGIQVEPEAVRESCAQWNVVWRTRMRHRPKEGPGQPPYWAEHH